MYRFTIIIPHKNIPDLLNRCINSIPKRDDIKVVVVDDNSDDAIVDFSHFPGYQRKHVHFVFSKKGLGGGGARNLGLDNAEGQWVLFADSDDFFHDNLSSFLDGNFDSDADVIVFDTDSAMSDSLVKVSNRETLVAQYKKANDENVLRYCHHAVWGKMFRLSMIKEYGIRFQEVAASNDVHFAMLSGLRAKKVLYIDEIVYCCTVRKNSICTRLTLENVEARIFVTKYCNSLLKANGVNERYWMNMLGPLFNLRKISLRAFYMALYFYLTHTPMSRMRYDLKESGGRFWNRLLGNVNDKDIKMLQKQEGGQAI